MKKFNKGFTLIELLAVVLIIGILTSMALTQYRKSIQRAESVEAMTNLKTIYDSARRYRAANSEAPVKLNGLDVSFFDADTPNESAFNIGNYRYSFATSGVSACRLSGSGSADNTYCLTMTYDSNGALTCSYTGQKYSYICEMLGLDNVTPDTPYITFNSGFYTQKAPANRRVLFLSTANKLIFYA